MKLFFLAAHPQSTARLAGHGADPPARCSSRCVPTASDARHAMVPRGIDSAVRKFPAGLGLDRRYSAHSMRATSYHSS
jgi:hypothetical protein